MELIHETYNIKYTINEFDMKLIIYNNDTEKTYMNSKNISEYKLYSDIGINVFTIIIDSFDKRTFIIDNECESNIRISFCYGMIKIPIICDYVRCEEEDEYKVVDLKTKIRKLTRELNEQKASLIKVTRELEDYKKYMNAVIEPLTKYVYIGLYRINKYKKILAIGAISRSFHQGTKIKELEKVYENTAMHTNMSIRYYGMHTPHEKPVGALKTETDYKDLDLPFTVFTQCVDIEEVIQMESEILLLAGIQVINFELLKHYKGKELYLHCSLQSAQKEQFIDVIGSLSNLTVLSVIVCGNGIQLDLDSNFFRNLKSLKKFYYHSNVVKVTSRLIDMGIEIIDLK